MPNYTNAEYDIEKAFRAIEDELIASMMRNLDGHRAEETDLGYNWTQWQVEQLKALEKYKKENAKKFSSQISDITGQIKMMLHEARIQGETDQEQNILRAIRNGFQAKKIPNQGIEGTFFRLNTRKLEALQKATTQDIQKASYAMLRMANDKYRQIIYNAQVYATTGAGTYEKAVDMATKDFLRSGINCIEYRNGSRHTVKEYAKMAIQTANKRAYLTGEGEMRKAWGVDTVILNKRGNACPKCLPFVGKILIDDVWSGGKPDGKHKLMSQAIAAGLYHPNCKDSHTTYFSELEESKATYTKKELQQIQKDYRQDQQQQYAKRQAEKFDRLEKYSLDPDNKRVYGARKEEWESRIDEYNPDTRKNIIVNKEKFDIIESDLGEFKKRLRIDGNVDNEYYSILKEKFAHGSDDAKTLFRRFVPNDSVEKTSFEGTAYFNPKTKKISMHYLADVNNPRGSGATWFHEHGHLIDNALGEISNSKKFRDLLEEDAKKYRMTYGKEHGLKTWDKVDRAISQELNDMRKHSAVSDIMEGVTRGNVRGVAGHSMKYWEDTKNISSEAFAHMYEAQFDSIRYEEMKKYFPDSLQYFEDLIKKEVK